RVMIVGNEKMLPERFAAWRRLIGSGVRSTNAYGPTEDTITSTIYESSLPAEVSLDLRTVPIGRPLDNKRVYVLDGDLRPVPVGVAGELYIGGAGQARGYHGRSDLTAEKFVPDPFGGVHGPAGSRLYRTGDLTRYLPGGDVEFLGRVDHQVKIRGFRIELGEIETVLRQVPSVETAVVQAREDVPGDRRLVAYLVGAPEGRAATAELRRFVRERLPEYMVPSAFLWLESLPLTPNGKVDLRALPAPETSRLDLESAYVAPRTPVEEVVAAVWGDALGVERVGAEDNFFELGGHSLVATRVISRLRDALGLEVPLRDLFEAPTVSGLAGRVEQALRSGEGVEMPAIERVPRDRSLPLSFAQQRLWFLDQLDPASPAYNLPDAVRLSGPLSRPVLAATLSEIVRRHESLRTTFGRTASGEPVQRIAAAGLVVLPVVDLSSLPEPAREPEALRLAHEEARRPFDLERGPLLRVTLIATAATEHAVLLTLHHIVGDGWSAGLLVQELGTLYTAFAAGRPSPLPELAVQYADFAHWQRQWLSGAVLERQLAWWRERLSGVPTLELPADRPRPAVRTARGGSIPLRLPAALSQALAALNRRQGVTPFMTLLGLFQALLARHAGVEDLAVGSPIAGRTRSEVEPLIGFFVNTLVLRSDLSGDPGVRQLLDRVREATLGAYAHQDLPFERLVEELAPERDLARTPLFQVVFALQNVPVTGRAFDLAGLELRDVPVSPGTAKFDLSLSLSEVGDELLGAVEYSADLFDAPTVVRLAERFQVLLEGAAGDPERPVWDLPLLPAAERQQVLVEWSDTAKPCPQVPMVHELVSLHARQRPEATAMADAAGRRLTYGELEARSNRLAWHLSSLGVGPDVLVAVCTERTLLRPVGILGIVKAGGAYVTLDPSYPSERLAFLMADSGAPVLLTEERFAASLPETEAQVVLLDGDWEGDESAAPESGVTPDNLAYVVYTSGSTGKPKGVEIPHAGLMNLVRWHQDLYAVKPEDRGTQIASPAFDASIWELWPYLSGGSSLHIPDEETRLSSPGMVRWWAEQGITLAYLMTPLAEGVLEEEIPGLQVRALIIGGDRLHRGPDPEVGFRLMNHYGPAEYSVTCTVVQVPPRGRESGIPTIGRAIDNTRIYLLDRQGRPAPVGVPGELYVAGVGLARGYHNRPDLTAEKFVPDPFVGEPGARMYRTADLVRWLPDGDMDFLGRLDHQVKIRGFRIELGEIESALGQHPGVREAVVLAWGERPDGKRLAAYVVAACEPAPSADELQRYLKERLPEYMVPASVLLLDALPLTPNGKVDRRALPAPEAVRPSGGGRAPRTPMEELVAGVWAEVLGVERVGIDDSFFELGGHSLMATRVVSRLRSVLGVQLPLRTLFEAPTVAELARRVEQEERGASGVIPKADRGAAPPLSFAQQRLWFLDQLEPDNAAYNVPLTVRLAGRLERERLGAALDEVVRRHESLRTTFGSTPAGEPVQRIAPAGPVALPVVDLAALPAAARAAEGSRVATEEAERPFDLDRGPLLRVLLIPLGAEEHLLQLTMHHIASDGWSMGILIRELGALYERRPSPLPQLEIQYADFAAWQRRWLAGEVLERELAYWRERLAGAPVLELPTDRARPASRTPRGARRRFELSGALTAGLETLARREGATLFMTLLAAFQTLLARHAGQADVTVGTPIAGRNRLETEGLIGFFVNTLVLRTGLGGDPPFRELLGRVRESALSAYAHQDLPFEKLVEVLQPQRDLSRTPLFQVMFVLQNTPVGAALDLPGLRMEPVLTESGATQFDLTLTLGPSGGGLTGELEYSLDLFEEPTIRRLAGHLETLLVAVVETPEERLPALPLLAAGERHQLLAEWNDTRADHPLERPIHELFSLQAARTPEAPAVRFESQRLSFGELEERSNRLARRLRRLGVGPESRVGICLERGLELTVALLGVLKAGGAYVPLDPGYPRERLAFMLEDSAARVVVAQASLLERLPDCEAAVVCVDCDRESIAAESAVPVESGATAESLAYVIYTSGSTAQPKGVLVPHRAFVNHNVASAAYYEVGPGDRFLQFASISFDVAGEEFFIPWLRGATVVLRADPTSTSFAEYLEF
ncbi:MAG TPA: amino acid adenylation domain-containing protein, partial [Thermoanaerobaculia bacterium]|nr:amino acid adenylation domain-containing protein [Thermoanaerobaculia bacterium]